MLKKYFTEIKIKKKHKKTQKKHKKNTKKKACAINLYFTYIF